MWGSHLTRGFIAPSALCPTFVSTPLWPLHFTSCPLCPRTVQVPWLWAKAICQTFSAIPELPVLPKNAGTSEGQSEWWRHVPSWEGLETDPTCILSQHSLLGKGAERQVSQCCLWTERGSFMRLAVGPWLRTFAPSLTHKPNALGAQAVPLSLFLLFQENP